MIWAIAPRINEIPDHLSAESGPSTLRRESMQVPMLGIDSQARGALGSHVASWHGSIVYLKFSLASHPGHSILVIIIIRLGDIITSPKQDYGYDFFCEFSSRLFLPILCATATAQKATQFT